ncbi:MAG TPA: FtsX-like permease family protein [Steroidobacteraceae bacterium]|nr:FtsX-like permease family protein [Steroidobacteraceae bacterium]
MELRPILSAMRRNKVGAILIGVQMAITLAILCNALFIIEQRVALAKRPTGLDESNIFIITNQWVGSPTDLAAKLQADLAALRATPGVIDATASNSYPLSNGGSTEGVRLAPEQKEPTALTALYMVDEHGLNAMGLKLIAGRNFNADEVMDKVGFTDLNPPVAVIITKTLADKAFPGKSAVGQSIYSEFPKRRVPIVGVVDRLQVPWTQSGGWGSKFSENSSIMPFRFVASYIHYIVRAQPGQIKQVQKAAEKTLIELDRARVIEKNWTLTEARADAYQDDRGLVVILSVVCAALVAVTAFGIVGLTSYWVAQRRRQIGIRRALGATRQAIVRYFQTENFLIAAAGSLIGVGLAIALNLWMVSTFEMERLHTGYAFIGALLVLLLGQLAVLWPALKAASVPPALATRAA